MRSVTGGNKTLLYAGTPENASVPQCENLTTRAISREVDLAWLAGILDGEGCLELRMKKAANGKSYLSPKVRIYNTDIRMIEKVSRVYEEHNLVFFYTLGTNGNSISVRTGKAWKTQIGICIASQGTTKKLLQLVLPYLGNKQKIASVIIEVIDFVSGCPKGGNSLRFEYADTDTFKVLWSMYQAEKSFYIDPSTTTRRASKRLDDIV